MAPTLTITPADALIDVPRQTYARIRPSGHAQRVPAKPALTPQPAANISLRTPRHR